MLIVYLITSVLMLVYTLVIGIGLTKIFKKNFFYFPIFFTVFIGGLSFVLSILHLHFWFLFLIPFLVSILPFYRKIKEIKNEERFLLNFFVFMFFLYIILQIFLPYYPLGRDWYFHYTSSLEISKNNFQFMGDRNPLFNVVEAGFLTLFGRNFYIAQIVSSLIGSFIIFPYYLLSMRILKPKIVLFSLFFLIFNLFVLENILYNWPKMLSATFTLYFIYFILERNYNFSWISASLGFLTHQLSLFVSLPVYLIKTLEKKKKWLKTFSLFLIIIFVVSFVKNITGNIGVHYLVPFAVDGYEKAGSIEEVFRSFFSKPFYYHFFIRGVNLINTLLPVIPILKTIDMLVGVPTIYLHKIVDISTLPMIYYYFHSLPGSLTIGVYLFAIISIFKNRKDILVKYIIISALFGIFYFGYIIPGVVRNTMHPIIPLLILYSLKELQNRNKGLIYLVFSIMIFELFLFFYLYMGFINVFIELGIERGFFEMLNIGTINRLLFG